MCLVDAFTFLLFLLGEHLNQDSFLILLQISWRDSCSTRISWFLFSSSRFVLLKTIALLRIMVNSERCKFLKCPSFLSFFLCSDSITNNYVCLGCGAKPKPSSIIMVWFTIAQQVNTEMQKFVIYIILVMPVLPQWPENLAFLQDFAPNI